MPTPLVALLTRARTPATSPATASRRTGLGIALLLCLVTRVYAAVAISVQSASQGPVTVGSKPGYFVFREMGADPGYLGLVTNWDGQWYEAIATQGYQLSASGAVGAAQAGWMWAFPPLYPELVAGVMASGLSFALSASLVSLVAGGAAVALLYLMLESRTSRFVALSGVAALCCFVTAPLLQVAYSESLALLLLVATLWLVMERRYEWAVATTVVLALTRIVTPALAVVVAVHLVWRLRRRRTDSVSPREFAGLLLLGAVSLGGGLLWSAVARAAAGTSTGATSRPVSVASGLGWFGHAAQLVGWPGVVLVALLLVTLVLIAMSPWTAAWPIEVRTWLWCYPLFILAVTPITTGILRYLLLCFPLGLLLAGNPHTPSGRRRALVRVVVGCGIGLALQWWWVGASLVVTTGALMP